MSDVQEDMCLSDATDLIDELDARIAKLEAFKSAYDVCKCWCDRENEIHPPGFRETAMFAGILKHLKADVRAARKALEADE